MKYFLDISTKYIGIAAQDDQKNIFLNHIDLSKIPGHIQKAMYLEENFDEWFKTPTEVTIETPIFRSAFGSIKSLIAIHNITYFLKYLFFKKWAIKVKELESKTARTKAGFKFDREEKLTAKQKKFRILEDLMKQYPSLDWPLKNKKTMKYPQHSTDISDALVLLLASERTK